MRRVIDMKSRDLEGLEGPPLESQRLDGSAAEPVGNRKPGVQSFFSQPAEITHYVKSPRVLHSPAGNAHAISCFVTVA